MKKSTITFTVHLDEKNIPEKILWRATDGPTEKETETKSINIALWDHQQKNTLRIDLWTKDMPIHEMKRFYIDCMGGMAQTLLKSTGDEFFSKEIQGLCDKLVDHLKKNGE